MSFLLGGAAIGAAAALIIGAVAALRMSQGSVRGPHASLKYDERIRALNDQVADLRSDVAEMGTVVAGLPSLWETERQRVEEQNERASKRLAAARAAESRAKRAASGEDDEDRDDSAEEAARLLEEHASGGNGEGMHPMSESMVGHATDDLTERALQAGWTPYL